MRVLVIGGTSFIGRAIVGHALLGGDEVTIFNRGKTGAELFEGVERRTGDRTTGDYGSLAGGEWDAVVDVSGYVPRHVREALGAVDGRAGRYLFISTVSVYSPASQVDPDEDSPRLAPEWATEEVGDGTYGSLKVACEDELLDRRGPLATIVRPGIVAGPYDPTDRFTWWVRRVGGGGTVPIAGRPEQPVQVIDVDDLAALVLLLVRGDIAGTFNAVGPAEPASIATLAAACAAASGTGLEVVSVPDGPTPPLVLGDPSWDGVFRRSAARARALGLPATPLVDTASKVLDWDRSRGLPPLAVGPPAD